MEDRKNRGSIDARDDTLLSSFSQAPVRAAFEPNQPPKYLAPRGKVGRDCEAKHSLPPATEVKKAWNYTSVPTFTGCFLIKRGKFTLLVI